MEIFVSCFRILILLSFFVMYYFRIRGLHEESEVDERSRREYEAMLRQMGQAQQEGRGEEAAENKLPRSSNSMWSRLKRSP